MFLSLAARSLDNLKSLGLAHASWTSVRCQKWVAALSCGLLGGLAVYGIVAARHVSLRLSTNWSLIVLQLTLGPILEELLFRGYLFAALEVLLRRIRRWPKVQWPIALFSAILFSSMHITTADHGVLQFLCISAMGGVYGWIRVHSGSTAPAAAAHAMYNLTLYIAAAIGAE